MALCCNGGVCIPYTALLPLLALGLKWLLTQCVRAGLIPQDWLDRWGLQAYIDKQAAADGCCNTNSSSKDKKNSCCDDSSTKNGCAAAVGVSHLPEAKMPHIYDTNAWDALWQQNNNKIVIVKMTAAWCRPCKLIQPHYAKLATHYSNAAAQFCTLDVDECDDLAAQFNVAMMPTFLILQRSNAEVQVVDRYAGSDAGQLSNFVAQHLSSSSS